MVVSISLAVIMINSDQPLKSSLAPWKWASVIILIYVFVAGWIVPLKPGIGNDGINPFWPEKL